MSEKKRTELKASIRALEGIVRDFPMIVNDKTVGELRVVWIKDINERIDWLKRSLAKVKP